MEDVYPEAHIFCLPTYHKEGVPKALIEAAVYGRPLIATDVPGCREIVKDGFNGILIPPRNAVALASSGEKLCVDVSLRKQMGKNSRKMKKLTIT